MGASFTKKTGLLERRVGSPIFNNSDSGRKVSTVERMGERATCFLPQKVGDCDTDLQKADHLSPHFTASSSSRPVNRGGVSSVPLNNFFQVLDQDITCAADKSYQGQFLNITGQVSG